MANESVLITFLGRVPRGENGYRTTRYDFGDGLETPPAAFFGWPLTRRIEPGRLVILGTSGSMWDHLFEGDLDLGEAAEEKRILLSEAVDRMAVTQPMLDELAPLLSPHLRTQVHLKLIPYCHDSAEQSELLSVLAAEVGAGDEVDLDITHSLRHLPMLGLLSALHLRRVGPAPIRHIWYGAYDPDSGQAPVHDLSGLLEISDWLEALAIYDHSGDYGVFAALVDSDTGQLLREASFHERIHRTGQARSPLRKALKRLETLENASPALVLFAPELRRRISWAEGARFYDRQRQQALEALNRGQYLPAAMLVYEAFITRLVQQEGGDPQNRDQREAERERFDALEKMHKPRRPLYKDWDSLRRLRNTLVHGSSPQGDEVQRALGGPEPMAALLSALSERLLPQSF